MKAFQYHRIANTQYNVFFIFKKTELPVVNAANDIISQEKWPLY